MNSLTYSARSTALLIVDPHNDFQSEGGKVWPFIKDIAEEVRLLDNLRVINKAVRDAGIQVTLVKDATAALKREMMHAAHELNGPTYAHAIVTTD